MSFGFGFALPHTAALAGGGVGVPTVVPPPTIEFPLTGPSLPPAVTFTRASSGTYFNSALVLADAAINVPRFDYDPRLGNPRGLLIEEARFNVIRNNTMAGAGPGVPPTNWSVISFAGLTATIVGAGTEGGISYVDINYAGTTNFTSGAPITFDTATNPDAAAGPEQTWTFSMYAMVPIAQHTNVGQWQIRIQERDINGTILLSGVGVYSPLKYPDAEELRFGRYTYTYKTTHADTKFVTAALGFGFGVPNPINFTIRIGVPQLEKGDYASSTIKTSTAGVRREADRAAITGTSFSSWFNSVEGTLQADWAAQTAVTTYAWAVSDGGNANLYYTRAFVPDISQAVIQVASIAHMSSGLDVDRTTYSQVLSTLAYKLNDSNQAANGVLGITDTSCPLPPGVDRLNIGASGGGVSGHLGGWVKAFKYWNTRLSDNQLIAVTPKPAVLSPPTREYALVGPTLPADITLVRTSPATYFDASGVLQTAADSTPRFDHDPVTLETLGLLIEVGATNSIANNTMLGASGPNTPPTGWVVSGSALGITRSIATGVEDGIPYVDVRYVGTPNPGSTYSVSFMANNAVSAGVNQTWTSSAYIKLSGNFGGSNPSFGTIEYTAGVSGAANLAPLALYTGRLAANRIRVLTTTVDSGTTHIVARFNMRPQTGVAVDVTVRIGLPQLERGVLATSVIKTSTAVGIRSPDNAEVSAATFRGYWSAFNGTLHAVFSTYNSATFARPFAASLDNTTAEYTAWNRSSTTGNARFGIVVGDGNDVGLEPVPMPLNTRRSVVGVYARNDCAAYADGGVLLTDSEAEVPQNINTMTIGRLMVNYLNGWVKVIRYWDSRQPNEVLPIIATLPDPMDPPIREYPLLGPTLPADIAFSRSSPATYFNSAGVLTDAANNVPRFDYNPVTLGPLGLLIEDGRTNSVSNNTMVGADAGTNTLPTGWAPTAPSAGLTRTVVGVGVEDGIAYIDLQLTGAPSAVTSTRLITFMLGNVTTASSGQTWAGSAFVRLIGVSSPTVPALQIIERTSGGTSLGVTSLNLPVTSAPLRTARYLLSRLLNQIVEPTGNVTLSIDIAGMTIAQSVDITLRIGLPQLELGAFATSVIKTANAGVVLRAADGATMSGAAFTSFWNQAQGTIAVGTVRPVTPLADGNALYIYDDVVAGTRYSLGTSIGGTRWNPFVQLAGVTQATLTQSPTYPPTGLSNLALAYAANSFAASTVGIAPVTVTSGTPPAVNIMRIGRALSGGFWNGHIQYIRYWPTRLSNEQLQQLTGVSTLVPPTTKEYLLTGPGLPAGVTFVRATPATYFDRLGILREAASGAPRFDYDPVTLAPRGLLIEETRTNSIPNNTMVGAVPGTPGTPPTGWHFVGTGLAFNTVATGTENGVPYVDIQVVGLTQGTSAGIRFMVATPPIVAVPGEVWTGTFFVRRVAGDFTGVTSQRIHIASLNSGGGITADAVGNIVIPTAVSLAASRFKITTEPCPATTTGVRLQLFFSYTSGSNINFTVRIGLPQLEKGAFATSPIKTVDAGVVPRNADIVSVTGTNFSSWYNQNAGTFATQYIPKYVSSGNNYIYAAVGSTTADAVYQRTTTGGIGSVVQTTAGGAQAFISIGPVSVPESRNAGALTYAQNDFNAAYNGALGVADGLGTPPLVIQQLGLGNINGTGVLNGWLSAVRYWNARLPDAQLLTISTPDTVPAVVVPPATVDYNLMGPLLPPAVAFTRSPNGPATYFDSNGTLQVAATDVPRFDYDPVTLEPLGLLIEEARTNSIPNNTMVGAGTPIAIPVGWVMTVGTGMTYNTVSVGTEDGIAYIDMRFSGTPVGNFVAVGCTNGLTVSASQNQVWTASSYVTLIEDVGSPVAPALHISEYAANGSTNTANQVLAFTPVVGKLAASRIVLPAKLTGATTAFAQLRFRIGVTPDAFTDFTLRIGLPQLELGGFATSAIKTTNAAASRSADVAGVTGADLSAWYNQSEGTVQLTVSTFNSLAGQFPRLLGFSNATTTESITISRNNDSALSRLGVVTVAGTQVALSSYPLALGVFSSIAAAYKKDDFAYTADGGVAVPDTLGTVPPAITQMYFSALGGLQVTCSHIKQFRYWPVRMPDAQLQAISAGATPPAVTVPTATRRYVLTGPVLSPEIAVTRPSPGNYFDNTGVLQSAANHAPRFDHHPLTHDPLGLLIEETRTNFIPNNTMVGAVPGAPGTQPTGWTVTNPQIGLTREIVAVSSENGIDYIDIKFSGLSSGTSLALVGGFVPAGIATTVRDDWWSFFAYYTLVGGDLTGVSNPRMVITMRDSTGASIGNLPNATVPLGVGPLAANRVGVSNKVTNDLATSVTGGMFLTIVSGVQINFTVRIGLPQLEKGEYPSSVLKTVDAGSVTRTFDQVVVSSANFTPWFNPVEGTVQATWAAPAAGSHYVLAFTDGSAANVLTERVSPTVVDAAIASSSLQEAFFPLNVARVPTAYVSSVFGYKANDCNFAVAGQLGIKDTNVVLPVNLSRIWFGSLHGTGGHIGGWMRSVTYWNTRLTDTQLHALSGTAAATTHAFDIAFDQGAFA